MCPSPSNISPLVSNILACFHPYTANLQTILYIPFLHLFTDHWNIYCSLYYFIHYVQNGTTQIHIEPRKWHAYILGKINFFFKFCNVYQVLIRTYRALKFDYIQFHYQYCDVKLKLYPYFVLSFNYTSHISHITSLIHAKNVLSQFISILENDMPIFWVKLIFYFILFYNVHQVQIRTYHAFEFDYIQFHYQYWQCQNKILFIFRSFVQLHITHTAI